VSPHCLPRPLAASAAVCLLALFLQPADGQVTSWQAQSDDWSTAGNWTAGVPTSSASAYIVNGGTATISSAGAACYLLGLGGTGSGYVQMPGGTATVSYDIDLENGTFNLYGTGQLSAPTEFINSAAAGFTQSGGTNTVSSQFRIATGARGAYNLSGGSLCASTGTVGEDGVGTFTQSGGTNATNRLILGYISDSNGTYNLSAGSMNCGNEVVGEQGVGTFTQTGGTNTVGYLELANNARGSGTYNLNGGRLVLSELRGFGTAAFDFSGGTLQAGGSMGSYTAMPISLASGSATFETPNGYALSVSGALSGPGSLEKTGSGTLTLAASNTYSGGTTVSAGTLQLGDGTANNGYVAGTIADNAALNFANPSAQAFMGAIFGSGSLTKSGTGTLTLSGSNMFTGGTTVAAGTLALGSTAALLQSTLDTSGGGALSFGNLAAATLGGLQGSGSLVLNNTASAGVSLTVGNNKASTTLSGSLSGSGSLVKVGSGTLTLAASNTYSGTTTISGGMLAAGAAGALSPYSGMTLSGGTLANLAFPNAVKSLTVTSGMLELGTGHLLTSTGAASLGGALSISGTANGPLIELLAYSSETGSFATVTGLPTGYGLKYKSTELDLVAVPEPSTFVLLAAAGLGLLAWRRRGQLRTGATAIQTVARSATG